ncbi:hypothetical protein ACIRVF_20900 [Kitasatospora sp. NPDC101157]
MTDHAGLAGLAGLGSVTGSGGRTWWFRKCEKPLIRLDQGLF